jgi:hypothetical protein
MRGLGTDRTASVIVAGLAFMQNLRRGHYEIATDTPQPLRMPRRSPTSPERSDRRFATASRRPPVSECNRAGFCGARGCLHCSGNAAIVQA